MNEANMQVGALRFYLQVCEPRLDAQALFCEVPLGACLKCKRLGVRKLASNVSRTFKTNQQEPQENQEQQEHQQQENQEQSTLARSSKRCKPSRTACVHIVASSKEAQSVLRVQYMHALGSSLLYLYNRNVQTVLVVADANRLCLNAILAVGCLGFRIIPCSASVFCIELLNQTHQQLKVRNLVFNNASADDFQFQTVWDRKNGEFRSSYFNTKRSCFEWSRPRPTLFVAEVLSLKQRNLDMQSVCLQSIKNMSAPKKSNQRLEDVWDDLMHATPETKVYVEMNNQTVFFGVAGDLQERARWQRDANYQGLHLADTMKAIYFTSLRQVAALVKQLNQFPTCVVLNARHLHTLPRQALCNLSHQWSAGYVQVLQKLVQDPSNKFANYVLSHVVPDASKLLWPTHLRTKQQQQQHAPTSQVILTAVVVALAMYPTLLGSYLVLLDKTSKV